MCLAIMFVSTLLISSQSHISHSVISNLLHLHSYLMITLLYHCTINTFLHCISLLFVFLFRVHALLQHHSHALLSTTTIFYLTFICIHFSAITLFSSFVSSHSISCCLYYTAHYFQNYLLICNTSSAITLLPLLLSAITLSHF